VAGVKHVLWIGGPPASGKTTIAARLARRYGLRLYAADTRTWAHRDRALARGIPAALRWEALTPEERAQSTPGEALELSLHRERGPMVVEDLLTLPRAPLVLAEGSTLPAAAVRDRSRALWLIPTAAFQRARLEERGLSAGARGLFLLLAETIEREAREHDVPILIVDDERGIDAVVEAVERHLAEALAEGPSATTLADRRALLREANEAVVAQVRGYFARPWAEGGAEEVVRTFLCECGERRCASSVEATVAVAAAAPVVTPAHA
jgi:hypothetical protein